jgi:hypoxanthine-DNA glycosylase
MRTRVLVLGSLPGEKSLAAQRYYGNPRNQFWQLIGGVIGIDLVPLPYPERLESLLAAGIGLWDSIGEAKRRGSLDTAIRDHVANDLTALASALPRLRAVGFNGGKSAALGVPMLSARRDLALVPLPSSSPAYTLPLTDKADRWRILTRYL